MTNPMTTLSVLLWNTEDMVVAWQAPSAGEWTARVDEQTSAVLVRGYGGEVVMTLLATSSVSGLLTGGVMMAKAGGGFAQHWVEADEVNRFRQELTALLTALCAGREPHR